ncbi:MAG TPA: NosD domain-containing protein [Nitrospira sp.]|nr:NosD domain-containing protein [Nitrospira sp.]
MSEPLVIPSRFTLAGTGIDGQGRLRFIGLSDGVAAIRFDNGATNITIRDLSIGRVDGGVNAGIDLSRANKVYIHDVLVTGFFAGIYGSRPDTNALSVYVDCCSIFNNSYNIAIHRNAFHWRIRDCILNQAQCWGVRVFGSGDDPAPRPTSPNSGWGNDHLISGCRIEGCGHGGVLLGSDSAMLMNNRFEQNGGVGGVGISVLPTATRTRLVSNLLASNRLLISSKAQDTKQWENMIGG